MYLGFTCNVSKIMDIQRNIQEETFWYNNLIK